MKLNLRLFTLLIAVGFLVLNRISWSQTIIPVGLYNQISFKMQVVKAPFIPKNTENILQYGAIADGMFDNSKAISAAMEAANKKGGGTIIVPLDGVTFQNSSNWCLHPLMCENVIISGITVRNPWYSQNGDGLDLESCKNAVVYNCSFDIGDDAICMKSGKDEAGRKRSMPCENVIVSECVVYHGHGGFVIGSEMSGGIRNFDVSKCLFIGTDVGLRFKSTRGRGGIVENIYIMDINMLNIPNETILFDLHYGGRAPSESEDNNSQDQNKLLPVNEGTPCFRNIFIKNITCNGARRAMYFNGLPEMNLKNISVENSIFKAAGGADLRESDGINMENVIIDVKSGPIVKLYNVKNRIRVI